MRTIMRVRAVMEHRGADGRLKSVRFIGYTFWERLTWTLKE